MVSTLFQIALIGMVQGLTEFLPVSSSAHVKLASALMQMNDSGLAMLAMVQLGSTAAVLWYFRGDVRKMGVAGLQEVMVIVRGLVTRLAGQRGEGNGNGNGNGHGGAEAGIEDDMRIMRMKNGLEGNDTIWIWAVIWGTIPVGVAGLALKFLFKNFYQRKLRAMSTIAVVSCVMGVLMIFTEWLVSYRHHGQVQVPEIQVHNRSTNLSSKSPSTSSFSSSSFRPVFRVAYRPLTPFLGFLIGLAQAGSLIPGVSRSGATITTGLLLGMSRYDVVRFSFLLGVPAVVLAGIVEIRDVIKATTATKGAVTAAAGATTKATNNPDIKGGIGDIGEVKPGYDNHPDSETRNTADWIATKGKEIAHMNTHGKQIEMVPPPAPPPAPELPQRPLQAASSSQWKHLVSAFVFSALTSHLGISLFYPILQENSLYVFGIYRILFGIFVHLHCGKLKIN